MNIKPIAGIMAVMLVFAACGSESADNNSKSENTTTTTTTAPAETEAAAEPAETTTTTAEPETETTTTTEAVTETEPVETSESETESEADTAEEQGREYSSLKEYFVSFIEDYTNSKVVDVFYEPNDGTYEAYLDDGTRIQLPLGVTEERANELYNNYKFTLYIKEENTVDGYRAIVGCAYPEE